MTFDFTVAGIPIGLNGVPRSSTTKPSRSDRHRRSGGDRSLLECHRRQWRSGSAYGWCKDKWGISWQITPRVLTEAMAAGGDEAKRAFEAMMTMKKIDVAAIEAARRG